MSFAEDEGWDGFDFDLHPHDDRRYFYEQGDHRPEWYENPVSMKQLRRLGEWMVIPKCPKCGAHAKGNRTDFGIEHRCCGLRSRNFKPLVTEGTLKARMLAHEAFDQIWGHGYMTRPEAYAWLASKMGMKKRRCHMAMMTEDESLKVYFLSASYIEESRNKQ